MAPIVPADLSSLNWTNSLTPTADLPEALRDALYARKPKSFVAPDFIGFVDAWKLLEKARRVALRSLAASDIVASIHQNRELTFAAFPVSGLTNTPKLCIHKSRSHGRRQSSAYYVALIGGRPAYVRTSNHWGAFSTAVYAADNDPSFAGVEPDQYGRVGYRLHTWTLEGGKRRADGAYAATSQCGVIFLDEE